MFLLVILILSFILSFFVIPYTINFARKANILKPKCAGLNGIPCIGGMGIYIGFLVPTLLMLYFMRGHSNKITGLVLSATVVLLLGFVDDIKDLRPALKLFVEFLAALILISSGVVVKIVFIPMWANILITAIWILFITNAFNLLDIMDGLSSGMVIIISLTLLVISMINKDVFSCGILLSLAGAHLAFLFYNYPPAKVYMGDTGSLFSGFILAGIAINISYAPLERKLALLTPILAMSLPIYDSVFLIIMRMKKKKNVFNKTNDHFVLRLITMGYTVSQSIWFMYLFALFLAVLSVAIAFTDNLISICLILIAITVFIAAGKKISMVKVE